MQKKVLKRICEFCNKEKEVAYSEKIKKYRCHPCYKKYLWKPKHKSCKRCKRMLKHHAKGLCPGCYSSTYNIDLIRLLNSARYHKIKPELYEKLAKKCVICGFNKIIELHHVDHNNKNNSEDNLVGLCPNHHKMVHHREYQKEIFNILKEKGFKIPKSEYSDGFFKKNKYIEPNLTLIT